MTALILVVASLLVLLLYWLETSEVGRWPRLGLATLRILQLSIVLFMMYGWVIQRQRTDLPDLAVIVDESASMSWHDHYTESREREQASEYARKAGLNPVTRWNVATALLAGEEQPWLPEWAQRYRLNCFLVGEETRPLTAPSAEQLAAELRAISPKQASSRLGDGLLQVLDAQRGRPTAAVVFLTDGASTGGVSLAAAAQAARQRQVPIYVVGLGDASPPRDRRLFDLRAEEIVFVDDLLTLDVQVASTGATQSPLQVQLRRAADGAVLDEQIVQLPSANSTTAVRLVDRPRGEGTIDYLIELLPEEGETNLDNNRLVHRVEVRDQTLRVLVIQGTPSYEYRALRKLLSRALKPGRVPAEKAIALTTILQEADAAYVAQEATAGTASPTALAAFPVSREELFAYDVVIFGDTDPALLGRQELQNLVDYVGEQGGGVVFSAGPRHLPKAFEETPLTELFPFSSRIDDPFFEIAAALSTDDSATRVPGGEPPASASGEANRFDGLPTSSIDANVAYQVLPTTLGWESPLMQLGATRRESETIWSQLPGVYAGGRMPALKPGVRVLAEFHGGPRSAAAARPALTLQFLGAGKVLFLALDETYRWSRYEGGEQAYARFWLQMIRYLSRSRLRSNEPAEIASDRDTYQAQDEVQLYVRFGDERLVPEQDDAVEILVESADARRRSVRLSRDTHQRRHFRTTLRDLPTGTYRATLVSPLLEPAPRAVEFVVEPPTAEMTQLQMRTQDLKQVASVSGGRFYTLASANRLSLELPRGRQLPVETLPAEPIWNSSLLTSLFLVLLTSEWIIRKQLGML